MISVEVVFCFVFIINHVHNINYNIYSSHLNVFFVPQLCTSINYMFMNINFAVQIHLPTTEGLLFVCCSQNYAHSKSIFPVSNSDLDRFVWCSYYKEIIAAQKFNTTWQNILKLHVFYIHFYSFADLVARQQVTWRIPQFLVDNID